MSKYTSQFKADSLTTNDNCIVPMVVIKKVDQTGSYKYHGFVPGLTKSDIVSDNVDTCKSELLNKTKSIIKDMLKENQPFPFFPNKDEISEDFDNVCDISYLKIK